MNKRWNSLLRPLVFLSNAKPKFSLVLTNQIEKSCWLSVDVNMQLWNPHKGIVFADSIKAYTSIPSYGTSILDLEMSREITEQEMFNVKNRNNLHFYVRGLIRSRKMIFREDKERFCYIYNAWEEPRPRFVPLFVPCGGFGDLQKDNDK